MHTAVTRVTEEKTFNLVGIETPPPREVKAAPKPKASHGLHIGQQPSKQNQL
jgi:hypothetical protein